MSQPIETYKDLTVEKIQAALEQLFPTKAVDEVQVQEADNGYYRVSSKGFLGFIPKAEWDAAMEKAAKAQ